MHKIHHLKSYFILFYMFGVSSYTPIKKWNQRKQIPYKILKRLPKILHISICILNVIQTYWDLHTSAVSLVEYIYLTVITATHIAIFIDDVYSVRKIRKMLLILFDAFDYLTGFLKVPVYLKTFEKNFRQKFFLSFTINVFLFLFKINTNGEMSNLGYFWFILTVYKMIGLFQVVFFLDFSNHLQFCLNQNLNQLHGNCQVMLNQSNSDSMVVTLRRIRKIHLKLCKIAPVISSRFGWFMILLLLELIVIPCICIFSIFVALTGPIEWRSRAYRKYSIISFCIKVHSDCGFM